MFGGWLDKYGNTGYTYIFIFMIATCVFGVLNALWAKSLDKKCKAGKEMDLSKIAE